MAHLLLLLLCLLPYSFSQYFVPFTDPLIQIVGRVEISPQHSEYLRMDWSGVQIATRFYGSSLNLRMEDEAGGTNEYNVFVDGNLQVVSLVPGKKEYPIAKNLSTTEAHSLLVTKRTEPLLGIARFYGLSSTEPFHLTSLPPRPPKRIEFIGDSITCGYGDEGTPPCPFTPQTENNLLTYGPVVARELGADYHIEAWSGKGNIRTIFLPLKGMVRNYGDTHRVSSDPFPSYFDRSLANVNTSVWNFKSWVPQAVVVNLGTNDFSGPVEDHPTKEEFENGYNKFISHLNHLYPNPQLFLVCGPMIGDPCCEYVQEIQKLQNSSTVHFINMQNILSAGDYGCNGHPNVSGQKKMAEIALPIIKQTMHW